MFLVLLNTFPTEPPPNSTHPSVMLQGLSACDGVFSKQLFCFRGESITLCPPPWYPARSYNGFTSLCKDPRTYVLTHVVRRTSYRNALLFTVVYSSQPRLAPRLFILVEPRAALGMTWEGVPSVRLLLADAPSDVAAGAEQGSGEVTARTATLLKHPAQVLQIELQDMYAFSDPRLCVRVCVSTVQWISRALFFCPQI